MSGPAAEPAVILIIDDDSVTLTGIAAVLSTGKYECHCARDGVSALAAARGLALDLIICDVNLDGDSGLALYEEIRRLPGCDDVPAMFTSSSQVPDIVRRSHEAGGAYYLRKPFEPEVLLDLVGKALWMPHLVYTRLNFAQIHPQAAPAIPKMARIFEAIGGIKMPSA